MMVKYADGPTTTAEVSIDAPPSVVWPLLCDINAPARFSQEFQGAEDIIAKRSDEHHANMQRTIEGYKQLAEAEGSGS